MFRTQSWQLFRASVHDGILTDCGWDSISLRNNKRANNSHSTTYHRHFGHSSEIFIVLFMEMCYLPLGQ